MSDIASILGQPFDPGAQEASQAWEPLTPGWYNAYAEKEEIKPTRAGDGYILKLTFCIIDGPSQNRKVFVNINLSNPSEKCVKIGKADLAAFTQSVDIPLLQDTAQLLNKAVQIRVTVKKDQNEIKGYKPIDQSQPVAPAIPMAPVPLAIAPPAGMVGGQGAQPVAPAPVAIPMPDGSLIPVPQRTPATTPAAPAIAPPVSPAPATSPPPVPVAFSQQQLQPAPPAVAPQPPISSQGTMEPWKR